MLTEMNYSDVYLLCQTASNLMRGGFERLIDDFFATQFAGEQNITAFSKESYLHRYCEWVVDQMCWDDMENSADLMRKSAKISRGENWEGTLWVDRLINRYQTDEGEKADIFLFYGEKLQGIERLADEEINDYAYDYLSELTLSGRYEDCANNLREKCFMYYSKTGISCWYSTTHSQVIVGWLYLTTMRQIDALVFRIGQSELFGSEIEVAECSAGRI